MRRKSYNSWWILSSFSEKKFSRSAGIAPPTSGSIVAFAIGWGSLVFSSSSKRCAQHAGSPAMSGSLQQLHHTHTRECRADAKRDAQDNIPGRSPVLAAFDQPHRLRAESRERREPTAEADDQQRAKLG